MSNQIYSNETDVYPQFETASIITDDARDQFVKIENSVIQVDDVLSIKDDSTAGTLEDPYLGEWKKFSEAQNQQVSYSENVTLIQADNFQDAYVASFELEAGKYAIYANTLNGGQPAGEQLFWKVQVRSDVNVDVANGSFLPQGPSPLADKWTQTAMFIYDAPVTRSYDIAIQARCQNPQIGANGNGFQKFFIKTTRIE